MAYSHSLDGGRRLNRDILPSPHLGSSLKMLGTDSVSGNPQTRPACRRKRSRQTSKQNLRLQTNAVCRTGGEMEVSMRRLYLSRGFSEERVK